MQNDIDQLISYQRFNTYIRAVESTLGEQCRQSSLELYEWNAELSGAFMFPFHLYEVTLRNCVAQALEMRYGQDWPCNGAFENSLKCKLRRKLVTQRGYHYTPGSGNIGKLLTELPLSFYESFFTSAQILRVWIHNGAFDVVFAHAPKAPAGSDDVAKAAHINACTSKIHSACKKIRGVRNRVAHHEPIFNKTEVSAIIPGVMELLSWRSPTARAWFAARESASSVLQKSVL